MERDPCAPFVYGLGAKVKLVREVLGEGSVSDADIERALSACGWSVEGAIAACLEQPPQPSSFKSVEVEMADLSRQPRCEASPPMAACFTSPPAREAKRARTPKQQPYACFDAGSASASIGGSHKGHLAEDVAAQDFAAADTALSFLLERLDRLPAEVARVVPSAVRAHDEAEAERLRLSAESNAKEALAIPRPRRLECHPASCNER